MGKFYLAWCHLRENLLFDWLYYRVRGSFTAVKKQGDTLDVLTTDGIRFSFPNEGDYLYGADPLPELLVSKYLKLKKGVFIDIGAFIGRYDVSVGNNVRVIAIEPNPKTFKILQRTVKLNGVQKRVVCVNKALVDKPKKQVFLNLDWSKSSLKTKGVNTVAVKGITFNSLLKTHSLKPQDIDLIKIDVEGYEYELLKGMSSFLSNAKKGVRIVCEILPLAKNHKKLLSYVSLQGFTTKRIDENNYLFEKQ